MAQTCSLSSGIHTKRLPSTGHRAWRTAALSTAASVLQAEEGVRSMVDVAMARGSGDNSPVNWMPWNLPQDTYLRSPLHHGGAGELN